jgi:hypothetical protein
VVLERIERAGIPCGNSHLSHSLVDSLEIRGHSFARFVAFDPTIEMAQLSVQPIQSGVHEHVDDGGDGLAQRIDDTDDRDEEYEDA